MQMFDRVQMLDRVQMFDQVQMFNECNRYYNIDHVMINRKENFFARFESSFCCSHNASVNNRIAIQSLNYELS